MFYGVIIILCFLSVGLWVLVLIGLRTLLLRQRGFVERLSVIEEILSEWMDEDELSTEESEQRVSKDESCEEVPVELPNILESPIVTDEFEPDNLSANTVDSIEGERARAIFMMAHQGFKPEEIAKKLGYSEGEVQLVLNLYLRKGKSSAEVS